MRRALVFLLAGLIAVAVAVGVVWRVGESPRHCRTTLTYEGVDYTEHHVSSGSDLAAFTGSELGAGTERGCGDGGAWSDRVAVVRLGGVDPGTALATPVAADVLYLARGVTLADLPSDLAELVER